MGYSLRTVDHLVWLQSLIDRRVPFEEIEDAINDLPLPSEAKSALWLWAWCETDRPERRRIILSVLCA